MSGDGKKVSNPEFFYDDDPEGNERLNLQAEVEGKKVVFQGLELLRVEGVHEEISQPEGELVQFKYRNPVQNTEEDGK